MLALGNVGRSGGGCNIYRGHDNVQGATDVGPNPDTLPGYYPVAVPGSWVHWARVWNVDLEWLKKRYASEAMMAKPGMTVSRWIDGVIEKNEAIDQDPNLRMMFFWGHAPNSQSRGPEMLEAMKKLDLMVVLDPYPSASAAMFAKVRKDGAYLLPIATQFECDGSATCSNRSLQWREKVIEPLFDSRTDHMVMYQLAAKLGFGDQFIGKKDGKQNIRLVKGKGGEEPSMEDTLRNEINKGAWTIGYTGQSPERIQAHMRNMHVFDVKTLQGARRQGREDRLRPDRRLLRPALAVLRQRVAQAPGLAQPLRHLEARHGRRRQLPRAVRHGEGRREPAGRGRLASEGRRDHHRPSAVRPRAAEEAGLVGRAHRRGEEGSRGQDLGERPLRRHPARGDEARLPPVRQRQGARRGVELPRPIPQHREPLFSPRPDMVEKYPTHDDVKVFWRLPTLFKSVQQAAVKEELHKKFPLILTSGRLVEYEGGGEETRSNPWLAELMQDNFVEINPKAAADRGIRNGEYVWVSTPAKNPGGGNVRLKVKAKVTEGVGPDTCFIPFHFSGWWQGEDMLPYYPEGAAPIVRGEAVNTATTYGYDRVTMMQETKTTLCQVAKA